MRLSNDQYFLSLLPGVAARSTCVRRTVGAIIVDENFRVMSMGFNGVPKGFPHCTRELNEHAPPESVLCKGADDPKGDTRRCMAVHAELNALLTCADLRHAHTMYVSTTPCHSCALAIANTSIKRIVCCEVYADDARHILEAAHIDLLVNNAR